MTKHIIGDAAVYLGDCLEVIPTLDSVDHTITDPPYEEIMQSSFGKVSIARQGLGDIKKLKSVSRRGALVFDSIDDDRLAIMNAIQKVTNGWAVIFCMAEGVRAWRDCIEASGARYKRPMVWTKPDAMPQFNGQGPAIGHEMMVTAWCGPGHSSWNGGGRPGNFRFNKNSSGQHPTQKPLPLMLDLVSLFADEGQTVLDPFMGSGTTGVACLKLGRKFIGIEKEQEYFDGACKRIEDFYKQGDFFAAKRKIPEQIRFEGIK